MTDAATELAEQLYDLQSRVAFQEDALQQLDAELAAAHQSIERLTRMVEALQGRVGDIGAWMEEQRDEPPPPHY